MSARAYILLQTESRKADDIAHDIVAIPGVISAELVHGNYDLVVTAEDSTEENLARHVARPLGAIDGVFRTITCFVASPQTDDRAMSAVV